MSTGGILRRINPRGQTYMLSSAVENDRLVPSKTRVSFGKKSIVVNAPLEDMDVAWFAWTQKGEYIQRAFPFLNPGEREFLMTGLTPEEWDAIFPPETEE